MKRVLAAVALFVLASNAAWACSCGGRMTVADEFADAPIVFVGRVESIHDRWGTLDQFWFSVQRFFKMETHFERHYCKDFGKEVTFGVEKAWKGVATRHVVLLTGRGGGDCGVEFQTGTDYIVYAWPPGESGCQTNICTRTREVSYGREDLDFLLQRPALKIR